jgi:hypothetical protein
MVLAIIWSIDAVEGYRATPTLGFAAAVPRVYKNGTLLTLTTDYVLSYPIRGGKQFTSIDLVAAITAADIITCDIDGLEDVGDGSGQLITNLVDQHLHWLVNFAFADHRIGLWNDPADYPIDLDSFARCSDFAAAFLPPGSQRFGGTAVSEKISDGQQRFLGTGLCFRPYWSEHGELALGFIDHRFHGFTSPGFDSDVAAVFVRGLVEEIGTSFGENDEASNLIGRVDMQALFGLDSDGRSRKSFQNISVEDVSQENAGARSFALEDSEATLE